MDGFEILLLGLGTQSPWKPVDRRLDVAKQPDELHLTVGSERGVADGEREADGEEILSLRCHACGPVMDFGRESSEYRQMVASHCRFWDCS